MKPGGFGPGGVGVGIIADVQRLMGQHAQKPAGQPERGAVGLLYAQGAGADHSVYPRAEGLPHGVPGGAADEDGAFAAGRAPEGPVFRERRGRLLKLRGLIGLFFGLTDLVADRAAQTAEGGLVEVVVERRDEAHEAGVVVAQALVEGGLERALDLREDSVPGLVGGVEEVL